MKNRAPATLLPVAAFGRSGCTAGPLAPEASPQSTEVTLTASAGPSASDAPKVKPVKVLDPETVKSREIANGRPLAAFDIECQVWKTPIAGNDEQAWANRLGSEFLESRNAECPDHITFPYYFIEAFKPGGPGELVVVAEDDLDRVTLPDADGEISELTHMATGVLDEIMDTNPDVEKVTVILPSAAALWTSDRREVNRVREIYDE